VSSSSGLKKGAYCWKGTVDTSIWRLGGRLFKTLSHRLPGGRPMMPYFNSLAGGCLRAVHHDRACDAPSHCAGSSLPPYRLTENHPLCRSRPPGRRSGVTRRAITFFSEPQSLDTLNFWAMATAAFFTP
jgi:hypothetical protein